MDQRKCANLTRRLVLIHVYTYDIHYVPEFIKTLSLLSAPSVVINITALTVTENEILVTWGRPAVVNGILSSYFVQYESIDGGNILLLNSSEEQIILSNLSAFTNYSIKV